MKTKINKSINFLRKHFFILVILVLVGWISFFSEYSLLEYSKLKNERAKLKDALNYYLKRTEENKQNVHILEDDKYLEKFAREKFFMKRDNEDVFLFEEESSEQ